MQGKKGPDCSVRFPGAGPWIYMQIPEHAQAMCGFAFDCGRTLARAERDAFHDGYAEGEEDGRDEGEQYGYDKGYDDAKSERDDAP